MRSFTVSIFRTTLHDCRFHCSMPKLSQARLFWKLAGKNRLHTRGSPLAQSKSPGGSDVAESAYSGCVVAKEAEC
jgi:hypothetical protein